MIKMFNLYYFLYVGLFFLILIGCILILKGKSENFKKYFISGMLFFALFIHFMKLLFPPYIDDELSLRKITPENICALSTLIFPFVFLSNNKTLKDYMFYVGIISGTLAVFFPAEAFDKGAFIFDTVRFYVCHTIITVAPFLMVSTGLHKIDYHRIYRVPICFFIVLAIIILNEVILIDIGLVTLTDDTVVYSRIFALENGYRNFSMQFGLRDEFVIFEKIFDPLVPDFMTTIPFGIHAGEKNYWPLVWMIGPVFVLIGGLSFLLSLPWEGKHIKNDFVTFKTYLKKKLAIK